MRKRFSGESSGRGTKCENVTSGADGCSARSAATLASKAPPGAPDVRSRLPSYVGAAASAIASAHGCTAATSFEPEHNGVKRIPYPPTVNDPRAAGLAMNVAAQLFGSESTRDVVPVMPAEDFSFFGETYPSAMMWLGAYNETAGATHPLHSTKYILDESVLTSGVALHAMYALEFLHSGL